MLPALLLPRCSSAAVALHCQNLTHTTRARSKFVFLPRLPFSLSSSPPVVLVASSSSSSSSSPSRRQPPSPTVSFPCMSHPTSSDSSLLTSSVGSPTPAPAAATLVQWNLDGRHVLVLNAVACIVAISASWLFLSAIPTLLAFKRAAESLEKLLDVSREELPDTMAAVRLSGMEISDLTMELSDLGEEITQRVRSSTRAVHLAEDRLRRLTNTPTASAKVEAIQMSNTEEPPLAKNARSLREGIVKGRAMLGSLSSLMRFSRLVWNFLVTCGRKRAS